jgi:hypothetical protein
MKAEVACAISEGHAAQLDLGARAVRCVVVGFSGPEVVLAPHADVTSDQLADAGTSYLLVEADGTLHALKARVRRGYVSGELIATLLDPFRLGQRRAFSRAPLILPAHVRPFDSEHQPFTTFTRDVSAGGARIARQSSFAEADLYAMTLSIVPVQHEIRVTAEPVRMTDRDVCMRFVTIDHDDRRLLAELTFAYHRTRAAT